MPGKVISHFVPVRPGDLDLKVKTSVTVSMRTYMTYDMFVCTTPLLWTAAVTFVRRQTDRQTDAMTHAA